MGQKAELSVEKLAVIVALHKEGYSKSNVPQNAVMSALQKKCETDCNQNCHHSAGLVGKGMRSHSNLDHAYNI